MQIGGMWLFIVLELLLIASAIGAFLFLQNRQLRAARSGTDITDSGKELSIEDYVSMLQRQILQTEAKLAQLEQTQDPDTQLRTLVSTRLKLLGAERKAIDSSGQDEDKLWAQVGESLAEFLPKDETAAPVPDQTAMITALQTRILAYQQRIANLEQFKEHFFNLKLQHSETRIVNQRLHDEVEKAIPEDDRSPELQDALQVLQDENVRLEQELSHVEQEFDNIMRNLNSSIQESKTDKPDIALTNSMDSIGNKVDTIRQFVNSQDEQIKTLNGIISGLQIELEDKQRIQESIEKLQAQNDELGNVIDITQEENTFLQEQISALLKQELETSASQELALEQLQAELDTQLQAGSELEARYAAMEKEYLTAFEENQRLKGT